MPVRGAQLGNQNARREHTRLAVSFSGTRLDLLYEKLNEMGEEKPTPDQVKKLIYDMVDSSLKKK